MGDVKSKGKLLLDAMSEADLDLWYMGDFEDPRRLQAAEKAATNYERAIAADLPAGVEAFLAEVEARASKATPGPWITSNQYGKTAIATPRSPYDSATAICGHYGIHEVNAEFIAHARVDVPALIGIIRKQAAELAHVRSAGEEACNLAAKLNARETERNAIMNEAVDVAENAGRLLEECASENVELRERLAKLESAARDALNVLGPEYFDDGQPLAELGRLVNIKGESNG